MPIDGTIDDLDVRMMALLQANARISNAELARHTNVSPQAMNNVVRGLQDRGVVRRPATVDSGRALPAELTAEGVELLKRAESAVLAAEDEVLDRLDPEQRRELKRLLAHAVN